MMYIPLGLNLNVLWALLEANCKFLLGHFKNQLSGYAVRVFVAFV